jgi:hypothetical protein
VAWKLESMGRLGDLTGVEETLGNLEQILRDMQQTMNQFLAAAGA